ncbi:MAG TPA: lipoyl synthase [Actinomycetota bacterium]|nr:lipoyl synthase [Actinomycetota bacterium]
MAAREKNPHKRRLHLPLVPANGNGHREDVADTHVAHSVGCAQAHRPAGRRPEWLKVKARFGPNYADLKRLMRTQSLHTVCEEAGCPNIFECWEEREATFLVLGQLCTRRCGFCDVETRKPLAVDEEEPRRIAETVRAMGLRYAVVTGVARDDLPDGGAAIWAETVREIRRLSPGCGVEVLPTDFRGDRGALATVMAAEPDVFAHNLETVRRLHRRIRPGFDYERSLEVLRLAKELRPGQITKSNLILGMGERPEEVAEALRDLRAADVDLMTLGQYLQPTTYHLPVDRWVTPEEFAEHARTGMAMGFAHVESGPLVRSSYHAGKQLARATKS